MNQKTITASIQFSGIGLHSGNPCTVYLDPAPPNTGIIINGHPAIIENAESSGLMTRVCGVMTVEHLLGYLWISGITNLLISVDGGEIPILDGSSLKYFDAITNEDMRIFEESVPVKSKKLPRKTFRYNSISLSRTKESSFRYTFLTNKISMTVERFLNDPDDMELVLSARTFCFESQIQKMKESGMIRGGTRENAVILDKDWNTLFLLSRSRTEMVDHKILDMIGDFSLIGFSIGDFRLVSSGGTGHKENLEFVRFLRREII